MTVYTNIVNKTERFKFVFIKKVFKCGHMQDEAEMLQDIPPGEEAKIIQVEDNSPSGVEGYFKYVVQDGDKKIGDFKVSFSCPSNQCSINTTTYGETFTINVSCGIKDNTFTYTITVDGKDQIWILSIDGGGIRGLIPAKILAAIEEKVPIRIADIFDMVAGTSTGSIISLGLTVSDDEDRPKFKASELVEFYENERKKVFDISFWNQVVKFVKGFAGTEIGSDNDPERSESISRLSAQELDTEIYDINHSCEQFEKLLRNKFNDKTLNEIVSRVNVLIPAYNITDGKEVYFTNASHDHRIVDVIRASTAAPTYFPAKQIDSKYYIDGGIFMNNPAFKAYWEAKKKFPHAKKFVICSLGTGYFQPNLRGLETSKWMMSWIGPLIALMMNAASNIADDKLESLGTDDFQYYHFQHTLQEDIPLDDTSDKTIKKLKKSC